jgi:WhiB family redox-sensing transcriptional regulator
MAFQSSTAWGLGTDADYDWRADAACRPGSGVDPELFFFDGKGTYTQIKFDEAKVVCFELCPVREQCLDFAVRNREAHGIYGGLTPDERRLGVEQRPTARRHPRCRRNHPLEGSNVGFTARGRYCRRCHAEKSREWQQKRRAEQS